MADFKATMDGDIDISEGISIVTGIEEARQRLDYAISLNLGEFFADIEAGLPYIENPNLEYDDQPQYFLFTKKSDIYRIVVATVITYIGNLSFIRDVTQQSYDYNSRDRQLEISLVCEFIDGQVINYTKYLDI